MTEVGGEVPTIPDGAEVAGMLKDVRKDESGVVLTLQFRVRLPASLQFRFDPERFLGQRVAILRLGNEVFARRIEAEEDKAERAGRG